MSPLSTNFQSFQNMAEQPTPSTTWANQSSPKRISSNAGNSSTAVIKPKSLQTVYRLTGHGSLDGWATDVHWQHWWLHLGVVHKVYTCRPEKRFPRANLLIPVSPSSCAAVSFACSVDIVRTTSMTSQRESFFISASATPNLRSNCFASFSETTQISIHSSYGSFDRSVV